MHALWPRIEAFEHATVHISAKFNDMAKIGDFLYKLHIASDAENTVSHDVFLDHCRDFQVSDEDADSLWWRFLTYTQTVRRVYNIHADMSKCDIAVLMILQLYIHSRPARTADAYSTLLRDVAPGASSPRAGGFTSPRSIIPANQRPFRDSYSVLSFLNSNFENILRALSHATGHLRPSVDTVATTLNQRDAPYASYSHQTSTPAPRLRFSDLPSLSLIIGASPLNNTEGRAAPHPVHALQAVFFPSIPLNFQPKSLDEAESLTTPTKDIAKLLIWNYKLYPVSPNQNISNSNNPFSPMVNTSKPNSVANTESDMSRLVISNVNGGIVVRTANDFLPFFMESNALYDANTSCSPSGLVIAISSCNNTTISIDLPVSFVSITNCQKCDIFLPLVSGCVSIHSSSRLRMHAISANVHIHNVVDSSFALLSPSSPVFAGECRSNLMGPYDALGRPLPDLLAGISLPPSPSSNRLIPLNKGDSVPTVAIVDQVDAMALCAWASPICTSLNSQTAKLNNINSSTTNPTTPSRSRMPPSPAPSSSPRAGVDEATTSGSLSAVYRLLKPSAFKTCMIPLSSKNIFVNSNNLNTSFNGTDWYNSNSAEAATLVLPEEYSHVYRTKIATLKHVQLLLANPQNNQSDTSGMISNERISNTDRNLIRNAIMEKFSEYVRRGGKNTTNNNVAGNNSNSLVNSSTTTTTTTANNNHINNHSTSNVNNTSSNERVTVIDGSLRR